MQLLTRPTQDKARLLLKLSQAQVAITKMYKQWVRQNNTQEFLTEYTELENHAKQPPPIVIKVPNCVQVSLMEMRLKHNLLEDLKTGQSVLPRYKQISEDMCRGLFPTTEVADWQKDRRQSVDPLAGGPLTRGAARRGDNSPAPAAPSSHGVFRERGARLA
eukprot:1632450-Pyramimonas_sp.AAC.1